MLCFWCLVWGRDYFSTAYSITKNYISIKKDITSLNSDYKKKEKDVNILYKQIEGMSNVDKENIMNKEVIINNISELDGVSIVSITALRTNSLGESVIIATVSSAADVSNFTDVVTAMDISIQCKDVEKTLKALEDMKLFVNSISVYPTDNMIELNINIGGTEK